MRLIFAVSAIWHALRLVFEGGGCMRRDVDDEQYLAAVAAATTERFS